MHRVEEVARVLSFEAGQRLVSACMRINAVQLRAAKEPGANKSGFRLSTQNVS